MEPMRVVADDEAPGERLRRLEAERAAWEETLAARRRRQQELEARIAALTRALGSSNGNGSSSNTNHHHISSSSIDSNGSNGIDSSALAVAHAPVLATPSACADASGLENEPTTDTATSSTALTSLSPTSQRSKREAELKRLGALAAAVAKKQQQRAISLTQQLRQQRLSNNGPNATTAIVTTAARKRQREDDPTATAPMASMPTPPPPPPPPQQQQHALNATTTASWKRYPPFPTASAAASSLPLTDAPMAMASTLLRIATRHVLQHRQKISMDAMTTAFERYTGQRPSAEAMAAAVSAHALLPRLVRGWPRSERAVATCAVARDRDLDGPESLARWLATAKRDIGQLMDALAVVAARPQTDPMPSLAAAQRVIAFAQRLGVLGRRPPSSPLTLDVVLGALLADAAPSVPRDRRPFKALPHFASTFATMDAWFRQASAAGQRTMIPTTDGPSSSRWRRQQQQHQVPNNGVARPFDVERESVLRQVRRLSDATDDTAAAAAVAFDGRPQSKRRRKADPMKIMCIYELSGVCNDEQCQYQHQRDFDAERADNDRDDDPMGEEPDDLECGVQLLDATELGAWHQLVQLRRDLIERWPSVRGIQEATFTPPSTASATASKDTATVDDEQPPLLQTPTANAPGQEDFLDQDFLRLSPCSVDGEEGGDDNGKGRDDTSNDQPMGATRYYTTDVELQDERPTLAALEREVEQHPDDVGAWILLALRTLDLEISWSEHEDVSQVSHTTRIASDMLALYDALFTPTDSRVPPSIHPDKLRLSLHKLSRALEVEANAYSEDLWLLHLHLSRLLPDRDVSDELELAEQGVGFVPGSLRLWRRYLELGALGPISAVTTASIRLLQSIVVISQQQERRETQDEFSVLMCDILVQLCVKFAHAGDLKQAEAFLCAFLRRGASKSNIRMEDDVLRPDGGDDGVVVIAGWEREVYDRMVGDDVVALFVLAVHLLVFEEVPSWLASRGFAADLLRVERLAWSLEQVQDRRRQMIKSQATKIQAALGLCELANAQFGTEPVLSTGMEVLRSNWALLLLLHSTDQTTTPSTMTAVMAFAEGELARAVRIPRVLWTLAQILAHELHDPDRASALVDELVTDSSSETSPDSALAASSSSPLSSTRTGERLHLYLLWNRDRFRGNIRMALCDERFPTFEEMVWRLRRDVCQTPTTDDDWPARFRAVLAQPSPETMSKALEKELRGMLAEAWSAVRDQLRAASRGDDPPANPPYQQNAQLIFTTASLCQLLGQVCGPRSGIEALETLLRSRQVAELGEDARQVLWSTRLFLQWEATQVDPDQWPIRDVVAVVKRYLDARQVATQRHRRTRQRVQALMVLPNDILRHKKRTRKATKYAVRRALALVLDPANALRPYSGLSMAFDAELLRLSLAVTPQHDRMALFTGFQSALALNPEYVLRFSDHVMEHGLSEEDSQRSRQALRRYLGVCDAHADPDVLRRVVHLELKRKNVSGLASILQQRLSVNPFDAALWALMVRLEALVGKDASERVAELAEAITRVPGIKIHVWSPAEEQANSQLSQVSNVDPDACTLDWSSAGLVEVPILSIPTSSQLRELNLANNALTSLPRTLGTILANLEVLNLAHNNLTEVPNEIWDKLSNLRVLDLRDNALATISPRIVRMGRLTELKIADNRISWDEFAPIASKLPHNCAVDIAVTDRPRAAPPAEETAASPNASSASGNDETRSNSPDAEHAVDQSAPSTGESVDGPTTQSSAIGTPRPACVRPTDARVETETVEPRDASHDQTSVHDRTSGSTTESSDDDEVEFVGSSANGMSMDSGVEATARSGGRGAASSDTTQTPPLAQAEEEKDDEQQHTEDDPRALDEQDPRQLRTKRPQQWRDFVRDHVDLKTRLGPCALCEAPNAHGHHQRLNAMVLCLQCIHDALSILSERHGAHSAQ